MHQPDDNHRVTSRRTIVVASIIISIIAVGTILSLVIYFPALTGFGSPSRHSSNVVATMLTIAPANFRYYLITVPSGATFIDLKGSFQVTSGVIDVYVMNPTNYATWQSGGQPSTYYHSDWMNEMFISAALPGPGSYYLVYSNVLSNSTKTVSTIADLIYYA